MNKGISLLDIVFLQKKGGFASLELQDLIKQYGTLERNITLHINLMAKIPEMYKTQGETKWLNSRPFHLLVDKIQEIEKRIVTAVNIAIGDDGFRSKEVLEIFQQLVKMDDQKYTEQVKHFG